MLWKVPVTTRVFPLNQIVGKTNEMSAACINFNSIQADSIKMRTVNQRHILEQFTIGENSDTIRREFFEFASIQG